jgi:hypothetical protein
MRAIASLHWAATLAFGITLVSAPSGAQTVNKAAALDQLLSGSGIPLPAGRTVLPPRRSTAAKQPTTKFETPFDRVMAPMLTKMKKAEAAKSRRPARSAKAAPNGVDGSNTNFPGFVSAPFVTVNDGDTNLTYVSVSGDFNKDGLMDVAQIKRDGTIDVLLNLGTFANIASLTPLVSPTSNNQVVIINVVAADMNGDGYPDLVGMDIYNNAVVVWLNQGDGTFAAATSYPVTLASGGVWFNGVDALGGGISVGDFNGDGAMDVVAISVNSFYVPAASKTLISEVTFINNGAGQLIPLPEEDTTFPDYFLTNYGELAVFTNDGNKASGIALFLLSQNLNTNYEEDMVIATMASNGDGTFKPPVVPTVNLVPDNGEFLYLNNSFVATNLSATAKASSSNTMNPPGTPGSGVPTTDFVFMYGDGAVYDASYTTGNPTVGNLLVGVDTMAYLNGGVFDPPVPGPSSPPTLLGDSIPSPMPDQATLSVADMNGDGTPDLVVYGIGNVYIFPNAGKGVFTAAPTQVPGPYPGIQEAQPANYDGSGYNSLITSDFLLSEMGYYQNRGAASSTQAGQFVSASLVGGPNVDGNFEELGGNIDIIATADVNGDGVPDLIGIDKSTVSGGILDNIVVGFRNPSGAVNQSSDYAFTTAISQQQLLATNPQGFTFMQPFAITSPTGGVSILFGGNSSGPLLIPLGKNGIAGTPVTLSFGIAIDCTENYADAGDINGDGIPDIVIAYGGDSSCYGAGSVPSGFFTFLSNADGTYKPATFTALGNSLYSIRLINFSGAPGNLDLAAIDTGGLSVWVVPNKADGSGVFSVANATQLAKGYFVSDIIPGDYNSDGKQDLTLAAIGQFTGIGISTSNYVPNTSGVLLLPGNGDYTFGTSTQINLAGAAPLWGAYADFNGDGTPDLALAVDSDSGTGEIGFTPMVQILPNLGGGTFGPAVVEMDGTSGAYGTGLDNASINDDMYLHAGKFSNSGGPDLLISCAYGTSEFVNQGVTTLALTSSSTAVGQGTPITLTATVGQVVSSGVASGTVTFSDNGSVLGIVETTNGVATLTTTLPVGSDVMTATYVGDALHNQAAASPITVTVASVAPAFLLTATPATLSLAQGATGTVVASLAGNSTFSGAVTITCSGAPAETSCSASPANVMLSAGQSASVSIVVATTPPNNIYQAKGSSPKPTWMGPLSGMSLAGLAFILWPNRRRRSRLLAIIAMIGLTLGASFALSGCSSSAPTYAGTTAGAYTLTVTATSGGLTQTLPITLTVTQAK